MNQILPAQCSNLQPRCIKPGSGRWFIISKTKIWSKNEPRLATLGRWHPLLVFRLPATQQHQSTPVRCSRKTNTTSSRPLSIHSSLNNKANTPSTEWSRIKTKTSGKKTIEVKQMIKSFVEHVSVDVRNGSRITRQRRELHHHQVCIWWSQSGVRRRMLSSAPPLSTLAAGPYWPASGVSHLPPSADCQTPMHCRDEEMERPFLCH